MKLPKDAPFAEIEGMWAILLHSRDPCSDIEKRPCSWKLHRNLFHLQLLQRFPGQQFKWKGNIPVAWTRSRILSRKFQWCFQITTQNQTTWTVTCYLLLLCVPVRSILASYWGKKFCGHLESCQFAPIVKFCTSGGPGQVKMTLYLQGLVATCITCHQKKKRHSGLFCSLSSQLIIGWDKILQSDICYFPNLGSGVPRGRSELCSKSSACPGGPCARQTQALGTRSRQVSGKAQLES